MVEMKVVMRAVVTVDSKVLQTVERMVLMRVETTET